MYKFHHIVDSDLSIGKPCQLTTSTDVLKAREIHDTATLEEYKSVLNRNMQRNEKDVLDEMQNHLKQMEEELAIVGEESKDLQKRLITRQQELEKKV